MGIRCQVSGVSPLPTMEGVQLEPIGDMPDTITLKPTAKCLVPEM